MMWQSVLLFKWQNRGTTGNVFDLKKTFKRIEQSTSMLETHYRKQNDRAHSNLSTSFSDYDKRPAMACCLQGVESSVFAETDVYMRTARMRRPSYVRSTNSTVDAFC